MFTVRVLCPQTTDNVINHGRLDPEKRQDQKRVKVKIFINQEDNKKLTMQQNENRYNT